MTKILYSLKVYMYTFFKAEINIFILLTNISLSRMSVHIVTYIITYILHQLFASCSTPGLVYKISITSSSDANVT